MTNDELNYWLCLWYHIEILGKCVHEWHKSEKVFDGFIWWRCLKCEKEIKRFPDFPPYELQNIPDYLNDPVVILEILFGIMLTWEKRHIDELTLSLGEVESQEHFNRIVMLELKERHEIEAGK